MSCARQLPVIAAIALLGALPGCHAAVSPATSVSAARIAPTDAGASVATRAAFLVHSLGETRLVPVDPDRAAVTLPGTWSAAPPRLHGLVDVELALGSGEGATVPVCVEQSDAECVADFDQDRLAARLRVELSDDGAKWTLVDRGGDACPCVALSGISDDPVPTPALDEDDDEDDDCDFFEAPPPQFAISSVHGGVLYETAIEETTYCSGIVGRKSIGRTVAVRPGARARAWTMPKDWGCFASSDPIAADEVLLDDITECALGDSQCRCEDHPTMTAFFLRSGRLIEAFGRVDRLDDDGDACTCVASEPISPANCTSVSDPCGDPSAFPGLARSEDDYWVATDGSAALVFDGELSVRLPRRETPVRSAEADDHVLGVEFHATVPDVVGFEVPRLRVAVPALDATDASFAGSARTWGDRCVTHLRAHRLDAAEAACFAGLRARGNARTRGAIAYNLGRIAEARGDGRHALAWYRRSARLRPGNAAVDERIAALASG